MRSQDDYGEFGEMLVKLHCSFQTVHPRHLKVHQDHVGGRAFDGANRLLTTVRGGYDFKNRIAFKKGTKRMQERGRIVHRQHPPVLRFYLRHSGPAFLLKGMQLLSMFARQPHSTQLCVKRFSPSVTIPTGDTTRLKDKR